MKIDNKEINITSRSVLKKKQNKGTKNYAGMDDNILDYMRK